MGRERAVQWPLRRALEPARSAELRLAWEELDLQSTVRAANDARIGDRCIVHFWENASTPRLIEARVLFLANPSMELAFEASGVRGMARLGDYRFWPESIEEAIASESGIKN